MKIIALYLPQFHEIEENNVWWHKGYTEWDNLKKAKKYNKDNYQPRIPLDNNYYNLLEPSVLEEQSNLAQKYGIYGFCYYHYWFEGHLLLNKPIENMLKNPKVDIPFCMSWANHSWAKCPNGKKGTVLIEQKYGNKKDWTKHFNYLLPFFKDPRYIKIDDKPVLVIHNAIAIDCWSEMRSTWEQLAVDNGLKGLYYVNTLKNKKDLLFSSLNSFDAQYEFQPTFGMNNSSVKRWIWNGKRILFRDYIKRVTSFSYKKIWNQILKFASYGGTKTFLGGYVDWDNTSRWGKLGNFHKGACPERFGFFIKKLISKATKMGFDDFIFINAWNEWGEGAYLEPDEMHKYGYLEQLRNGLSNL